MQPEQEVRFGPYRFAPCTGQLWRDKQEVRLTPKAAAVLGYVVERSGQVVSREELFQVVWAETVVSDAALTSCIQEIRQALRDKARKPRYLETIYKRGVRFLGKVVSDQLSVVSRQEEASQKAKSKGQKVKVELPFPTPSTQHSAPTVVGREPDLAFLHERLEKAASSKRQLIFVTGEAGIGKTTLIGAFLRGSRNWELGSGSSPPLILDPKSQILKPVPWWLGWGQCIEHYGAGEAYLPILEALGRLCRESDGEQLMTLLHRHAPTWLVQMPALLDTAELEALQRRTHGATRERMLRELAEALEVITQERPLVLVLEDLHWSDVSTLDLLSMLARRHEPARLLIIGTYRPVEVLTRDHPLKEIKQELQVHGYCQELALDFLTEPHVAEYLEVRFRGGATDWSPLHRLAHIIHHRTDGNPLFMVNVTNELVAQEMITQQDGRWELKDQIEADGLGVPENLRQLIEQQLARVNPEERKILEAASVAGAEFSAVAVAVVVEHSSETVETHCDGLVRREQFLRSRGTTEWPDGTIAARYGFVHALYQEVLYEQISASRCVRLHQQIGELEEQAYGDRAREIATELAVHFERGRDYRRAIQYLQHAGEKAVRRSAHQEAISLLSKGLELLKLLPDTSERAQQELTLQIALGAPLMATKGFGATEVGRAYARARELCQLTGETSHLFPILRGLWEFYELRTEYQMAKELGEQLLALAQRQPDPSLLLLAHNVLADTLLRLGEFSVACEHAERGEALYDVHQHRSHAFLYGYDSGMHCLSFAAWALWLLGYPDQALKKIHAALSLARESSHPFTFVVALHHAIILHHLRREARAVQERAETEIALCTEQGFAVFLAGGTMYRGWALVEQGQGKEGIAQIHQALIAWQATGTEMGRPHFLALLAEAYGKVGEAEQGLAALVDALAQVEQTGERWYEAELYRLKGELTLAQSSVQSLESGVQKSQKPALPAPVPQAQVSLVEGAKGKNQNSENPNPQSQSLEPNAEAEACFLKAIDIAQKQQAKSLELRATTSLARLWQQQGKTKQAHKKLAKIYHWFTEGFDTKDLQEAKALLEEFGGIVRRE